MDKIFQNIINNDPKIQRILNDKLFFEADIGPTDPAQVDRAKNFLTDGKPDVNPKVSKAGLLGPAEDEKKDKTAEKDVNIFWAAILKAVTITKTVENNFLADVQKSFSSLKQEIIIVITDMSLTAAANGSIPYQWITKNGDVSKKKVTELSIEEKSKVIVWYRQHIQKTVSKQIDDKANPANIDNFFKEFMDLAKNYQANQIEKAANLFHTDFKSEDSRKRLELFLDELNKNPQYEDSTKHLYDIILAGGIEGKIEAAGSVDEFADMIQKMPSTNTQVYNAIANKAFMILKVAGPFIDEELKNVQAELGASVSQTGLISGKEKGVGSLQGAVNNIGGKGDHKKNNQAVQNVIGIFSLYTFLIVAMGVASYQSNISNENYQNFNTLNKIMIDLYNEGLGDVVKKVGAAANYTGNLAMSIKGAAQKTYYKLGKQYINFSSAVNSLPGYENILKMIMQNGTILVSSIINLEALGLLDQQQMQNAITNKVFEKPITAKGLDTPAIKKVANDFKNKNVIREIIKKVYAGLGIQKSKAAAAGEAVGGFLGKIANFGNKVSAGMPQKPNTPPQTGG